MSPHYGTRYTVVGGVVDTTISPDRPRGPMRPPPDYRDCREWSLVAGSAEAAARECSADDPTAEHLSVWDGVRWHVYEATPQTDTIELVASGEALQ